MGLFLRREPPLVFLFLSYASCDWCTSFSIWFISKELWALSSCSIWWLSSWLWECRIWLERLGPSWACLDFLGAALRGFSLFWDLLSFEILRSFDTFRSLEADLDFAFSPDLPELLLLEILDLLLENFEFCEYLESRVLDLP